MAMTNPIEPILHPIAIRQLRPTQFTVGMREVARKRHQWRKRRDHDGGEYLGAHMLPAVIGPGGQHWLIDHHHLARALHDEGVEHALVSVVADLRHVPRKRFFAFLDSRNWLHPYDEHGHRCDWRDLPRHVGKLRDDPYRSLAGEVREAGGYAKTVTPYTEFLWADYYRDRIGPKLLDRRFERALEKAVLLAKDRAASYLPGFAGPEHGATRHDEAD